jgi:hypothetical protein
MIENICAWATAHLGGIIALTAFLGSIGIEVSKVKFSPWSWLGKKVGKLINGDVITELDGVKKDIGEIKEQNAQQNAQRDLDRALDARRRILRFADEIRRGDRHSHEHFDNILEDISNYVKYCDEHPNFQNEKARVSIKIIEDVYEKCARENDFL